MKNGFIGSTFPPTLGECEQLKNHIKRSSIARIWKLCVVVVVVVVRQENLNGGVLLKMAFI